VSSSAPSYPSTLIGAGTLPRGILAKHNAHLVAVDSGGAPIHANPPALDEWLTYSNPTTIATLISAAAEVYAKCPTHQRSAPISTAMEFVS
jgi:hypothetical protein